MAKRNQWLENLQRKYAQDMEAQSIVIQYWIRQGMLDSTTLALHRYWGWGEKRLTDLNRQIGGIYCDEVLYGLGDQHDDSDVARELVDRELKVICPTLFVPWEERYEFWVDTEMEKFRKEIGRK